VPDFATISQNIREKIRQFRRRRMEIVTFQPPPAEDLAQIAMDVVLLAHKEGLTGSDAKAFAAEEALDRIEAIIQGNPDHWAGRMIESLDDYLPVLIQAAYNGYRKTYRKKAA